MAIEASPAGEGFVALDIPQAGKSCQTWYKVFGSLDGGQIPLLVLHGGPGATHVYLIQIAELHRTHAIPVILYDQVGCGNSTRLQEKVGDVSFWTIELFILELKTLCSHLGLDQRGFHLLGQSWGGMLSVEFAARRPPGLQKLIIQSAPASFELLKPETARLRSQLPEDVQTALKECEDKEDFNSQKYEEACQIFYRRHVCCLDEWPEDLKLAFARISDDPTVYLTM